jgi:alkylhydroperoxidase family enzyme
VADVDRRSRAVGGPAWETGAVSATWLPDLPPGETDWDRVAALFPAAFEAVAELQRAAWASFDPVVLELARLRTAQLLGFEAGLAVRSEEARRAGLAEGKVSALPDWPSSPLFSDSERACLAVTEQFVMDASGVTDELVAAVLAHYSAADCHSFVNAVSAFETFQRGCLTLGLGSSPEATWLSPSTREDPA